MGIKGEVNEKNMLIEIEENSEKIKEYNLLVRELKGKIEDFCFEEIQNISDIFEPYIKVSKDFENNKYIIVQKDYKKIEDIKGVYVCDLNANHWIERVTDYAETNNYESPIYWLNYGVADNASQVLDYYNELSKKHKEYMTDRKFVILLTPIFKSNQPKNGGWRWRKWGKYIGVYKCEFEYLHDEKNLDFVYVFNIVEVQEMSKRS